MIEWWTYRPSDFLMFAPRTYWRLYELHNAAWWPAPPLLVLVGLALGAWWLWRGSGRAWGVGAALLAVAWAFVALAFMLPRFAPVNWAATGFAYGFGVQAVVLVALAAKATTASVGGIEIATPTRRRRAAAALWFWAIAGVPLLASAFGRPWMQAEVFGLAPHPTAVATLGALLAVQGRTPASRALLGTAWALAIAWCAIDAATLATMGSWQAVAVLAAAGVAIATLAVSARAGHAAGASARGM
jgi:Family of unknown function (DUF6064)